jgi:hypothetical protein
MLRIIGARHRCGGLGQRQCDLPARPHPLELQGEADHLRERGADRGQVRPRPLLRHRRQGGKPTALLAAARSTQDFFATAIDCASAVAPTDVTNESGTYTIDKRNQPIWQAVGLTTDPGGYFDIVATVVTTTLFRSERTRWPRDHHRHRSAATDTVELRVLDGASLTKLDVVKALNSFERFFEDPKRVAAAGFDVSG